MHLPLTKSIGIGSIDDNMVAYRLEVRKLENNFDGLCFTHILRDKNSVADELSKIGSSRKSVPPDVFLHIMNKPSVKIVDKTSIEATTIDAAAPTATPTNEAVPEAEVMMVDTD